MNIRQYQSTYLCPRCNGEDQSFTSGQGDLLCVMFCHNCGHSIGNVVPGITRYGPLNPRVQVVTGRYVSGGGKPPVVRSREEVQAENIKALERKTEEIRALDMKKRQEQFIVMMGPMDAIPPPEGSRWDDID